MCTHVQVGTDREAARCQCWGWILPSKLLPASKGKKIKPTASCETPRRWGFSGKYQEAGRHSGCWKRPNTSCFQKLDGFSASLSRKHGLHWVLCRIQVCAWLQSTGGKVLPFLAGIGESSKIKSASLCVLNHEALSVNPLPYGIYVQSPTCAKSISLCRWIER